MSAALRDNECYGRVLLRVVVRRPAWHYANWDLLADTPSSPVSTELCPVSFMERLEVDGLEML